MKLNGRAGRMIHTMPVLLLVLNIGIPQIQDIIYLLHIVLMEYYFILI